MIKNIFMIAISAALLMSIGWGKSLRLAYDADPVSMDPHEQLSGGMLQFSHMVFDPLVRWTQDLKFEPRLATQWRQIDAKTTRFTLRKGVKFHSGNEMTARDVKWTFDRLRKSADFKGIFLEFEPIRVVDDYTIDIVTKGPYPLVLHTATYIFPMDRKFYSGNDSQGRSKALVQKEANTFASRNASGTGPFTVTKRDQGVRVDFARFNGYWDKTSKGNVTKVILTPIAEGPTRVAALLAGDVDFIAPVPPSDLFKLRKERKINLVELPGTRIITFQLNQQRRKEFRDVRVRQAIVHAINNDAIVSKIMRNFATVAAQQSPLGYIGYNKTLKPRYNLARARELMKEAGYPNGFNITLMAPNNRYVNDEKIAEAVASMLAKIKIKASVKTIPKAQYWPAFDAREADMMMIGWHSDTEDSANFTEYLLMTFNKDTGRGQYNSGNYSNPEVDKLVTESANVVDENKRARILQKVEKLLYDDAAFVPLHWQNLAWASRKGVDIKPIVNVQNFPYIGDLVIK
ncbi:peptide/nickel transport system substrate-binding protein [Spirochaetota bacterium]|nr:peptide/nickel transport system substrate-binding protein [Spirochaetota bacterium]